MLICTERLPMSLAAVIVYGVALRTVVGVPEILQVVLSKVRPVGSAGELVQLVMACFATMLGTCGVMATPW